MIEINLLPDSERAAGPVEDLDLNIGGGRKIDWFTMAPKILGGLLGALLLITVFFIFLPNMKRVKENDQLQQQWKKLEPDYDKYLEKENNAKEYTEVMDEFYRFLDERAIWSRHLFILAKNLPQEIDFKRMTASDEVRKFDSVEKISVEDEKGNLKFVERVVSNEKLVHMITIKGLVPIDGQSKVILFKKNLEKDDFLKDVLMDAKIPGITVTSSRFKAFTLELVLSDAKASRE